jgi:hypothetical protein
MTVTNCDRFQWDELLRRISRREVIPVIGQGLYHVEIEADPKKNILLYDYLAQQVIEKYRLKPPDAANHKFAMAALEFLRKKPNGYVELSEFLLNLIRGVRLVPFNPLWKLAGIKAFDIFITTAYDDLLVETLKRVRGVDIKRISYGGIEKKGKQPVNELFDYRNNPEYILVFHILGSMRENSFPAYTETDIMETLLELKQDMGAENQNPLFWKLQSSSLLFMGCGFDDWLCRFFIRIVGSQEFKFSRDRQFLEFIGEIFSNKKDPFYELPQFLENHHLEVFRCTQGNDFVDRLVENLEAKYPGEMMSSADLPPAFISFEGADREAAKRLASHLHEDGIHVWLDEREIKPGDEIDETVIHAIDHAAAFIPLISQNSKQIQAGGVKLKYHVREWERAYANMISGHKPGKIIPVKIDDTDWLYDKFKNLNYINVPAGRRQGDYEKLKQELVKVQQPG